MTLTRDQILDAKDFNTKEIDVPEWGGSVFIRVMSGSQRDAWEADVMKASEAKSFENMRAKLLARVLCDEKGDCLFNSDEDITALGAKSGVVLQRLFEAATKLNAISKEAQDELVKN